MAGGTRPNPLDRQYMLRALKELSQPTSEVNLPDGLLAVPLLRHQRIALSWMVQKETSSLCSSGGILADDQGLGKTVSTIALILKERPPLLETCNTAQNSVLEIVDLDDDPLPENGLMTKEFDAPQDTSRNGKAITSVNSSVHAKGRLSAGTLVVCPTSVLRQWADELANKVTWRANLSVLVYHGSNRNKDHHELAKYDVVLTTYSIVSLEVPKDDGEKESATTSKKRKCTSSSESGKKMLKDDAGPLAKVAWFRVVLDEAQSIKNYRTLVSKACWGLRAKRRWCLSGTPIQNSIDDLYSYFRFLRYDPYDELETFCSKIKVPITNNPRIGYSKLQAILKIIMLRRTKDTVLDGQPIISLPPKRVKCKRVTFSQEEHDFYSKLETDSRAQFQEYADAGTVKQNYVHILSMLLRLRQACNHPQLVKGYNSTSPWTSSVETTVKIPRERQLILLKCLEACVALCGICNDVPEDAVVSVCGHIFCNQCISEHLTGEDIQCPATNCKTDLSRCSVFSEATLKNSLSDRSCDLLLGTSGSEAEDSEPFSNTRSIYSSKIIAALKALQSFNKPKCHTSQETCMLNTSKESTACSSTSSGDVPKNKALVFSQWTGMLDLLEEGLIDSSIEYRRLDGTMSVIARDKAVKDFNTLPEVTVMIMSLKAACLGLNMVAACRVVMLDLWWNPTVEDQAIDRAHRIGQTRTVKVYRLTVKNTIEDRILALQEKKREMVASALGEDESGGRLSCLTVDDLKYLFMM
ncbi:helicase-like transcription factor CHR28 [Vicia villosa]|uniref:helicase-like transcription factor CHR28 n=1 Tax=Vicia villosa TaxID=3911 RepID=UPI00273CD0DC|nr:helicase-like transcription factor CHR28 [Vicia villosa]